MAATKRVWNGWGWDGEPAKAGECVECDAPIEGAPAGTVCRECSKPRSHGYWTVCCDKAFKVTGCVCALQVWCPEHGEHHHGTHD